MDITVQNDRPEYHFRMVPTALIEDPTLTTDAKAVLTYVCTRPTGWIVRVAQIRQQLGLGDYRWRRVSRELRRRGGMVIREVRNAATGEVSGRNAVMTWAPWLQLELDLPPGPGVTPPRQAPKRGNPTRGKPTGGPVGNQRRVPLETNRTNREENRNRGTQDADLLEGWKRARESDPGLPYFLWLDSDEAKAIRRAHMPQNQQPPETTPLPLRAGSGEE